MIAVKKSKKFEKFSKILRAENLLIYSQNTAFANRKWLEVNYFAVFVNVGPFTAIRIVVVIHIVKL